MKQEKGNPYPDNFLASDFKAIIMVKGRVSDQSGYRPCA
jgi:hypothetical protein